MRFDLLLFKKLRFLGGAWFFGIALLLQPIQPAFADTYEYFIRAARMDLIDQFDDFLRRGMDVNASEPNRGESVLTIAVREKSLRVVDRILSQPDLNINARAKNGDTALMLASYTGQLDVVRKLVKHGAHVNQTGWTALHYAAVNGYVDIMAYLLMQHAYIDAESPNGTTPLMMATRSGNMNAVKLLVDEGADIRLKNALGMSAIDFAVDVEQRDIAQYLRDVLKARQTNLNK